MRISSGKTDQKIFFVAVDSTDLVTRETGLSSFTVYRSRNGGTATVYTTPTITELSSSNMPGVYCLTIDEDTTIGSSSDNEEYCLHITHSGMAPVTRTIELYRRDTTSGRTLAVDSNSRVDVGAVLGTAQTAGDLAAMITAVDDYVDTEVAAIFNRIGAPVGASISADIAAVKSQTGSIETKVDTIDDFVDTEVAAIKTKTDNLPANTSTELAGINTKLDTIDDFLDTEIAAIKTKTDNLPSDPADASDISGSFSTVNGTLATIAGYLDTEIAAIKTKTDNLPASPAATGDIPSAASIADAIWDEVLSGHATSGTAGAALAAASSGGVDPETIAGAVWDALLEDHNVAATFGNIIQNIDPPVAANTIAEAVWGLEIVGNTTAGTFGEKLDDLTSGGSGGLDAAGVRDALGMASANLDTQLSGLSTQIDTVDNFVDTEVGAIKTVVDAIKVKTDNLPTDPADASDIATAFGVTNGKIDTVGGYVDTEVGAIKTVVDAIKLKTDNLPSDPASASVVAAAFVTTNGKIDAVDDYIDTEVAAIKTKTDLIPASPAAVGDIPTANQNADALLDRSAGIETGFTPRQTIRLMAAVLLGKSSGHPGSPVYRNMQDSADRVSATVSSGNRSAVTLNP